MIPLFTNIPDVVSKIERQVPDGHKRDHEIVNQLTRYLDCDIQSCIDAQADLVEEIRHIYLPLFDQLSENQQQFLRECISTTPMQSNSQLADKCGISVGEAETRKNELNTIVNMFCAESGITTPSRWPRSNLKWPKEDSRYEPYRSLVMTAINTPTLSGWPLSKVTYDSQALSKGAINPISIQEQLYAAIASSMLDRKDFALFMHVCMPLGSCHGDIDKFSRILKLDPNHVETAALRAKRITESGMSHFISLFDDALELANLRTDLYTLCDTDLSLVKDILEWADKELHGYAYRNFSVYAHTYLVTAEHKKKHIELSDELNLHPDTIIRYGEQMRHRIQAQFFPDTDLQDHPLTRTKVINTATTISGDITVDNNLIDRCIDPNGIIQMIARTTSNIEDYYIFCASKLYKKEHRLTFRQLDERFNRETDGGFSYKRCTKTQDQIKAYITHSGEHDMLSPFLSSETLKGGFTDINQGLISLVDTSKMDLSPKTIDYLHSTARKHLNGLEYVCFSMTHLYSAPHKMDATAISKLIDKNFNYIQDTVGSAKEKLRAIACHEHPEFQDFSLFRKFNIKGTPIPEELALPPAINNADPDAEMKRSLAKALLASDQYYFYEHLCTTPEKARVTIAQLGQPIDMDKPKASGRFRPCRKVVDTALEIEKSFGENAKHKQPVP